MKRQAEEEQEDSNKKINKNSNEYNGPSAIKTIAATIEFQKLRKYKNVLEDFFGCIYHVEGHDEDGNESKEYPHLKQFSKTCKRIGEFIFLIDTLDIGLNDEDLDWEIGFFSAILELVVRVYNILKQNNTRISESANNFLKKLEYAHWEIVGLGQISVDETLSPLDKIKEKLLNQFDGKREQLAMSGWDVYNTVVKDMPNVQKAVNTIKEDATLLCQEFLKLVEVPLVVDFVTQDGDLEFEDIKLDKRGYIEYDESSDELSIQNVYEAIEAGIEDMYEYCETHRYLKDAKDPYEKVDVLVENVTTAPVIESTVV